MARVKRMARKGWMKMRSTPSPESKRREVGEGRTVCRRRMRCGSG